MAITLVNLLNFYHFRIDLFSRLGATDCSILIKELMQIEKLNFRVSAADLQEYTAPIRDLPGMAEFARDVEVLNCSPCLLGGDLHKLTKRINDPQAYWNNGFGMDKITLWLHVGQQHNNSACRGILDKAFKNLAARSSRVIRHRDYQRGLLLKRSSGHDYVVEIIPMGLSYIDGQLLPDPTSPVYQMGTFESRTLNLFTDMDQDSCSRPATFMMRLVGDRSIVRVASGTPTTSGGLLNIKKVNRLLFFPFQWIPGTEINTTFILRCEEMNYDFEEYRRLCVIFSITPKLTSKLNTLKGRNQQREQTIMRTIS